MTYYIPLDDIVASLEATMQQLNNDCEKMDELAARIQDNIADADRFASPYEDRKLAEIDEKTLDYEGEIERIGKAIHILEYYTDKVQSTFDE